MNILKTFVLLVLLTSAITLSGCASVLEGTGGGTTVSATGGPAAILSTIVDNGLTGGLPTTPGGFTLRNQDPGIGAITNNRAGVSKDVDIYVKSGRDWVLYRGPAEVKTPGWVKMYEDGEWIKIKVPGRWLKIKCLEAIHFESPFSQRVTLRVIDSDGETKEVKFDTYGREQRGSNYERVNTLLIKLPPERYRLEIYSYTGKSVFKSVEGRPTTKHIHPDNDPVDTRIGNTWIGWKLQL